MAVFQKTKVNTHNLAINIQNLTKIYKNGLLALDDVNLYIQKGDFFSLLGPNGAGKSTLIGILSSLVIKTRGIINIQSFDLDKQTSLAKESLGIVPQEINFNIFEKCQDVLMNQAGYYGVSKKEATYNSEKYLKLLDLWEQRNDITRNLSGGMKRRLMIARALMHSPAILILDEPTAGVDIEIRKSIWNFLKDLNEEKKVTIVLTTHYLEEVEKLCRNVAIIDKGKIITHTSVNDLISILPRQSYILSLKNPIKKQDFLTPKRNFCLNYINEKKLEAIIENSTSLNLLFSYLENQNIKVESIKTKENPIENAFFHLTKKR